MGLWPSSLKLFGSRRTKQREVIKKPNEMSHLIDTELVGGNRKGEREEEGAKGRQNAEKKGLLKCVFVRAQDRVYQCMCMSVPVCVST